MPEPLSLPPDAVIAGYDFSTGGVKALAFDLAGNTVAAVRLPTDLWTEGGVSELNLMQLEGQARAATRLLAARLDELRRLRDWAAAGISATHHTAGRIDERGNQVRRAICWNDQTLAAYHAEGLARLGGQARARELTGPLSPFRRLRNESHDAPAGDRLDGAAVDLDRRGGGALAVAGAPADGPGQAVAAGTGRGREPGPRAAAREV